MYPEDMNHPWAIVEVIRAHACEIVKMEDVQQCRRSQALIDENACSIGL
jgi:hypothetical protein